MHVSKKALCAIKVLLERISEGELRQEHTSVTLPMPSQAPLYIQYQLECDGREHLQNLADEALSLLGELDL